MPDDSFNLWLEFEHWLQQEGDDPEDEIFNMQIVMRGGKNALQPLTCFHQTFS